MASQRWKGYRNSGQPTNRCMIVLTKEINKKWTGVEEEYDELRSGGMCRLYPEITFIKDIFMFPFIEEMGTEPKF